MLLAASWIGRCVKYSCHPTSVLQYDTLFAELTYLVHLWLVQCESTRFCCHIIICPWWHGSTIVLTNLLDSALRHNFIQIVGLWPCKECYTRSNCYSFPTNSLFTNSSSIITNQNVNIHNNILILGELIYKRVQHILIDNYTDNVEEKHLT